MQKSHKNYPQISEIMCYICYCLQNVINEMKTVFLICDTLQGVSMFYNQ